MGTQTYAFLQWDYSAWLFCLLIQGCFIIQEGQILCHSCVLFVHSRLVSFINGNRSIHHWMVHRNSHSHVCAFLLYRIILVFNRAPTFTSIPDVSVALKAEICSQTCKAAPFPAHLLLFSRTALSKVLILLLRADRELSMVLFLSSAQSLSAVESRIWNK